MDVNRLNSLLAAPLACLIMIPVLFTFVLQRPPSVGYRIPVVRIHHVPHPMDCDGRTEFARLTKDGRTWINETEVPSEQIAARIASLMEHRAERIVYVVVDSRLSFGQFADFLDKVASSTTDLHTIVISGEVLRRLENNRAEIGKPHRASKAWMTDPIDVCDFVFPKDEFKPKSSAFVAPN